MNAGKAIYYLLANNAGVSAITTRIYPEYAPQDADAPFIVYRLTSVDPDDTHDGPAVIDEVRIEVICVSDSYDQAADLGGVARVALDRVYGTYNTVNVESIQFDDVAVSVRDQPRQYAQELTFIVRVKRDDIQIATGSPIEDVTLGRLADVDTTGATDDQVLTYDEATDTWGPEDASTVAALDDLTDVTITTPANNQALVYNSAAGEWRNDALSLTQLEGIDSELGDAIDRQALVFDEASNQWIADGVGQVVIPVRNSYRDDTLTVGQVVKAVGAQGDRIRVALFDPATDDTKLLVGVISEEIAGGADGHAQVYGELRNIDTDAFEVGDILYPQSDGSLDTTENEYPIGIVTRSQQNTGRLFIRLWAPGKGYHQRYRTEAASEMFVGGGATVELYYTATADGDGYVTQDLTAAVGDGNVEERVLRYKAGAFGDSGTTLGYTDAGLAIDATYAEMLTAFNNLLKTESAPITIYATRTEVAARQGLLVDYPGAAVAYSLRLLDTDYTGSAIRVRRASDNAEQDIGFDGNGDLDTTSLATFCESNLYTSDFSINEDGLTASGATLTGNIDAFGLSDTLRFTVSATTGVKFITLPALVIGEQYRLSLKLYNPNTNTVVTGVRISNPNYANVLGASITTTNSWVNVNRVFTATSTDLRIFAEPFSIAGNGTDVIYFKDIQITQVTDGFVKTWYDQAGSNDATQTTAANQPKIYDSSTGVLKDADDFVYVDCSTAIIFNAVTISQPYTMFAAVQLSGNFQRVVGGVPDWSPSTYMRLNAGTVLTGTNAVTYSQRQLFTALANSTNSALWYDGTADATGDAGTSSYSTSGTLFTRSGGTNGTPRAYEFVIYASDQSTNRAGIETNINDYYSIYTP